MAEQAEADDVHDEDIEDLEHGEAEDQDEGDQGDGEDAAEEDDGDELIVQFGDEAAPASEGERGANSGLVKELRAKLREASERAAAYERGDLQPPKPIEVGERPTMESCDYDEARFEQELDAWKDRDRQAKEATTQAQKQQEAAQAAWQEELAEHGRKVVALGARDFDVAREEVASALSLVQQAALIKAADNSAAVAYALGKNPHKLADLAKIQDPIKFAVAVSKLEGTLKVTKTARRAVEPDRTVRGSASLAGGDKKLEALEAKAARTGNRTEVIAYKAAQKKRAK